MNSAVCLNRQLHHHAYPMWNADNCRVKTWRMVYSPSVHPYSQIRSLCDEQNQGWADKRLSGPFATITSELNNVVRQTIQECTQSIWCTFQNAYFKGGYSCALHIACVFFSVFVVCFMCWNESKPTPIFSYPFATRRPHLKLRLTFYHFCVLLARKRPLTLLR